MSDVDRDIWNQRYASDDYNKKNPVSLLVDWLPRLSPGKALDVACGAGRNALLLAREGFRVDAVDIAAEGLERARRDALAENLSINWIEHDLDRGYDFDHDYDLILVFWYVNLPLVARLGGCLAPGGYLICQEHLRTDQAVIGPSRPAFRVAPGDLERAAAGLEILYYDESIETDADGDTIASASLVARN